MDESSAMLIVGLGFFLICFLLGTSLEYVRELRADRRERDRHERKMEEARTFGYEPVQQAIANQTSFRRFIK